MLIAWKGLGRGSDLRSKLGALQTRHSQGLDPAGLHQRKGRLEAAHKNVNLTGGQGDHRLPVTLVGYMQHVDASTLQKQLEGQVVRAVHSGGGVGVLAWRGLGKRDELRQVAGRQRAACEQAQFHGVDHAHRREVAQRTVGYGRVEQRRSHQRAHGAKAQGVAVW